MLHRFIVAIPCLALFSVTCEPVRLEDRVDDWLDEANRQSDIVCDCYAQLDWTTRVECRFGLGYTDPNQRDCFVDVLAADRELSLHFLDCVVPLAEEVTDCLEQRIDCAAVERLESCFDAVEMRYEGCLSRLPASIDAGMTACYSRA